jgi:PAS domain S-box-containing protein
MKFAIENGLYKSIFDNTFDGIAYCEIVFDENKRPVDFIHLKVNKNFESLTGLKNVVGKKITKVIPGINISNPELLDIYSRVSLTGEPVRFESHVKQLNRSFLISVYSPKKGFFVVVFQNITEQKLLEDHLEDVRKATVNLIEDLSIEKDKAILSSISEGLIAFDNNRKIVVINPTAKKMLDWDLNDFEDQTFDTLPFVNEFGISLSLSNQMSDITNMADSIGMSSFYYLVNKDKTRVPVMVNITPIKIKDQIIGVLLTIRDVTNEREVERIKSEFLSLASHQLRTPLGICKWYAEAILDDAVFRTCPKTIQNYLKEIYKSNGRLITLVNDLLSVARIDQSKIEQKPKLISVTRIVKKTIKGMRIIAKKYDITLNLEIKKANIPSTYLDPIRIEEVLENLIANAISYSDQSGFINVVVDYKQDQISIAIIDTGIGIGLDDQKKIFTKFHRSKIAENKNTEGTGLGLYVAKSYVSDWGGEIKMKSCLGKGSTFIITIPITKEKHEKDINY